MDALKASLRVVLAHIRQVEIKIVEGVRGGVSLGNFNALWNNSHKYKVQIPVYSAGEL